MGKIIGVVAALVLLIGGSFFGCSFFGHGSGDGSGQASEGSASVSILPQTDSSETDTPEEDTIAEILIEGNKIYFDDELCVDENDLKQRITQYGTDREYNFKYDNAIKGTYDKVEQILLDLENALNIKVNRP